MKPFIPQMEMETALTLDKSDWIVRGLIFLTPHEHTREPKADLLAAFSSLVIEHFRSIVELCRDKQAVGSAFALFRPLLDASLRGQWLYLSATDDQRMRFMKNELNFVTERLGFKTLADAVDRVSPLGAFFKNFADYYSELCDLTHTGHDAVTMRVTTESIEPTYPEAKIRLLLETSARATALHFAVCSEVTGFPEHAAAIPELLRVFH